MRTVSTLAFLATALLCEATELIFGIENEIKDYNISRSVDKNAFALSELVTEALFYQRPDGSLVPDLVLSYQRQGKRWTFELRKSRFSSGKELGCLDVAANIEEARRSPRPVKARLREIESLHCEGSRLVILTQEEYPQLVQRMGHIIRVYEAATLKEKNPIGSGPYMIKEKKSKDIILVRNPYSSKKYAYDRIVFRALLDPWLRDLAVLSGNVDFLMETFSKKRIEALESKKNLKIYKNPSQMLFYFVLKKKKFSLEQRAFFRDVLYKENIVEKFWSSRVESVQKIFKETQQPSFASYTQPKPFEVEVSLVADDTQISFLKEVAQSFERYGIKITLRPLEFASYMKRLNSKNFDAYLFYIDTSHAQSLEALLHSRGNRLDVKDQVLDKAFALFSKSDKESDLLSSLNSLEKQVADEVYLIPLYRSYRELVVSDKIQLSHGKEGFWRDLLQSHKYTKKQ